MRRVHLVLVWLLALGVGVGFAFADPNPAPSDLTIQVVGGEVRLQWVPPDAASGNTQVRLLRRLNTPPAGSHDPAADLLYAGSAAQYVDPITGLLPDFGSTHVYHYSVFGCDAAGTTCEAVGSHASLAPTLVQCLRGGAYTIHWRHADADVCADRTDLGTAANTTVPNWWRSCDSNCPTATARQLNAAGVERAIYIGQHIVAMGVPIGRVVSSEFCRCIQTAESMNFGPTIETNSGITYWVYDEANRCALSYALLAEVPAAGTNTVVIGHAGFSPSCPTLSNLAWSECAVFKADGQGGSTLIGRLTWDAWGPLSTDVPSLETALATTSLDAPYESAEGVRLRYRLANAGTQPVRLEVFDIRGRRLWSLLEHQSRGQYERMWDRRDASGHEVPRGVYFFRLHTPTSATSRKAVILHH